MAPDEYHAQYSYGSEHLPHDGAIASLVALASSLGRIKDVMPGSWDAPLAWIDRELNRLWKARGAFPGLGSALCAFGLEQGTLIAYALAAAQADPKRKQSGDPWALVDALFEDPSVLPKDVTSGLGPSWRKRWKSLPAERRMLLKLLSRFELSADQAKRFYVAEERESAGIAATDAELLANPYLVYELDRGRPDAIAYGVIDRGLFPDPQVRSAFPVPPPSLVEESIDERRVHALVVDTLETAAREGHTLLPTTWVVQRARERPLAPACPLDGDLLAGLAANEGIVRSALLDGNLAALQLDRFVATAEAIRRAVKVRLQTPRHKASHDWAAKVAEGLKKDAATRDEPRARQEKAAALEEIFASRFSVLIGPAGTGKTTLLKMLCGLPEVARGGVLLLAPTGKARVRLEQQTGMRGQGQTLAQFLLQRERYDGETGRYFINSGAEKFGGARTVIVDECSMLTEEQLAALVDALGPIDRLILVGDPRQLPPIGAGRPFVDIVHELCPADIETASVRRARGYAELTVNVRQRGQEGDDRLLAAHFGGGPLDAAADEVWARISAGESDTVRVVQWRNPAELHDKLISEIARVLQLGDPPSEHLFELMCGGSEFEENKQAYFWAGRKVGTPGAAASVDRWQVLGAVRGMAHGVDALNREIQSRFRKRVKAMAQPEKFYERKIPKPLGPQALLWGDKVINIRNNGRRRTWPEQDGAYLANGDMGVIVGEYKYKGRKGFPKHLEVEFAALPGVQFKYWSGEFSGDDSSPELELAYALTVHKTQGSEFDVTFVVIPNPCRVLSRELLYTALTRHKDRVVLFHQGPVSALQRYSTERTSELAGRMTNLFRAAKPWAVTVESQRRFLDARLIHRTERGDLVRSKSEVNIADKLFARGVQYAYEAPLRLADGIERYPDFSFIHDITGVQYYWEHLGMLDDPAYEARWRRKLAAYRESGILPHGEGGGPGGALIITRDERGGAFDSAAISSILNEVLDGA
jgi:ATP-dependent exoDNAse (exonuclease V) alpha subunit